MVTNLKIMKRVQLEMTQPDDESVPPDWVFDFEEDNSNNEDSTSQGSSADESDDSDDSDA